MFKRLFALLMIFAFSVPVFYGCNLVTRDNVKESSQPVAVIAPREFTYKDDEGQTKVYVDQERVITKGQLMNAFNNWASQYQGQYGANPLSSGQKPEDMINNTLDQLINRQLYLRQANFLLEKGDIKIKQADINKIWKEIYKTIDSYIYYYETEIAKQFDEEIYEKGTGEDPEAKYPARIDYFAEEVEDDDKDEPAWSPERVMYPRFYEGMAEEDYKSAARTVEAMRRLVDFLTKSLDDMKEVLTLNEQNKYKEDLEKLAEFNDASPEEYAEVYPLFQELWMVEYLFYKPAYEELLNSKLQDYVVKDAKDKIEAEDVQREFNKILARQKATFDANLDAYKTARNDLGKAESKEYVILYDPAGVEQFYVKHILLPFDEGDTEKNVANIGVYERDIYGNEMVEQGKKSVDRVFSEVKAALAGLEGEKNAKMADYVFTDFIFKYNTDPGIFNNKLGYGLVAGEKSQFVEEFERVANNLYDKGVIGAIDMATTSYGVHIIMLSSIVKSGEKKPWDYADVTKSQTYFDIIKDRLVQQEEQNALQDFNFYLNDKIKGEWSKDITRHKNRYEDIIDQLKKQQRALGIR